VDDLEPRIQRPEGLTRSTPRRFSLATLYVARRVRVLEEVNERARAITDVQERATEPSPNTFSGCEDRLEAEDVDDEVESHARARSRTACRCAGPSPSSSIGEPPRIFSAVTSSWRKTVSGFVTPVSGQSAFVPP
jgi:hypothetical protein